jgi:hypothetical protein
MTITRRGHHAVSASNSPAKIERQDHARIAGEMAHQPGIGLRLAAEDQMAQPRRQPIGRAAQIGHAVVDPQRQMRKCLPQPLEHRAIVAPALDGVEIRDVQRLEWMDREQSARDVDRIAGGRKRRLDRSIDIALAHAGPHDGPALEVEDRNDLHGAITWRMKRRSDVTPAGYHAGKRSLQ